MAGLSGGNSHQSAETDDDVKTLQSMGYTQELSRSMKPFSNFAISFSIICILSGGINSLSQGISGVGGAAIGIGWLVGCAISLIFALGMAQISSAYPTAAINVGTFYFFIGAFGPTLGFEPNFATQASFVIGITVLQALINHQGIKLTAFLTDISGYLIFATALALTFALLAFAPSWDLSRLVTFKNYSGATGGDVWPATQNMMLLFGLGLLLPIYTITGFDASAHTAEETHNASHSVPKGIVTSVIYSSIFGYLMLCSFVIAIPDMDKAAASGGNVFFATMDAVLPGTLKEVLFFAILASQFLCGLATVTSASRMIFAFARDGGLPASHILKKVHSTLRSPVAAIWTATVISILFTLYTPAYTTIVSVTVIFIFISYGLPVILGGFAYGRSWTHMGPWNMGPIYRLVAILTAIAIVLVIFLGVQPPNDAALNVTLAFLLLTAIVWFGFERRRFKGPPNVMKMD
jgi:amino acid transporter